MEMSTNANALRELEEELHTELVPGTEVMTDTAKHHFIHGTHNDTVLVPQPTSNPHDPLNWSRLWKFSANTCATLITLTQTLGPLAISPIVETLAEDFKCSVNDIILCQGITIIVLGFSNFLWVPISQVFGRRIALLASLLITLASHVWRAKSTNFQSFFGAAALAGVGTSPSETLQPTIVADTIFLHERGFYNTLYFAGFFINLMLGPILQGAMAQSVGWQSFWWLNVALTAFVIVLSCVGLPETLWHRSGPDELNDSIPQSNDSSPSHADDAFGKHVTKEQTVALERIGEREEGEHHNCVGVGAPSARQFWLAQRPAQPVKALALAFWTPWYLITFPIVVFASCVICFCSANYLILTLIQAEAFSKSPYNFTPLNIGFVNFASLIGALIGLATAGPASDWVSMQLTKRNNGVREPEMRLPTMIPYVFIMLLGNFVCAFGLQHGWDWRAITVIGFGCAGIQIASLPAIAATYAVDSYKPVASSIFICATIFKNLWGYGVSKFITSWVASKGYVGPFMLNMCLAFLSCSAALIFWYWGKKLRRMSAKSFVHRQ
ncbi:MAG: hypothetical protein M1820_004199 [Bogoriella megaspora]|nr:MAG: hypothetical protein M1820_004199 [Bogoriella megaspora]